MKNFLSLIFILTLTCFFTSCGDDIKQEDNIDNLQTIEIGVETGDARWCDTPPGSYVFTYMASVNQLGQCCLDIVDLFPGSTIRISTTNVGNHNNGQPNNYFATANEDGEATICFFTNGVNPIVEYVDEDGTPICIVFVVWLPCT